jgi:uncharacterized protein YggE
VNETHASYPVYGEALQAVAGPVRSMAVPVKRGTQRVSADVTVVFSYSS